MLKEAKVTGEPGWKWRRAVIFPVVAYACWRLAMLESAPDTRVNETIAWGWMIVLMVLVLGYTGLATVQDVIAIWRTKSALPYTPESSPADEDCPPHQRRPRRGIENEFMHPFEGEDWKAG